LFEDLRRLPGVQAGCFAARCRFVGVSYQVVHFHSPLRHKLPCFAVQSQAPQEPQRRLATEALAFFRVVGAKRFIREGEALIERL
jgi:hypothetical protein